MGAGVGELGDAGVVEPGACLPRALGIGEYTPQTDVHDVWRRFVESAELPPEIAGALLEPTTLDAFVESTPDVGLARMTHAATHTTFAPTVVHGGVKTNVIPDTVDLEIDIRTLPGQTGPDIENMLAEALGDLYDQVEITPISGDEATRSKVDTPLWDSLTKVTSSLMPGAQTIPFMLVGATDARFFRSAGSVAYGYGMFSERISFADYATMFHGDNERIDLESLDLVTQLWEGVLEDFLG